MRQTQRLQLDVVRRVLCSLPGVALTLCLLTGALIYGARPARAEDVPAAARRAEADEQFARAEAMRATLEAKPERQRSLQDYLQLVAAYRHVYLITPRAPEVPGAIKQVGDLYRQMGDQFEPKYFASAVETYQFLAHDYPMSSLRPEALIAIADIQRNNLGQADLARQGYTDFLKEYLRSPRAADARRSLAELKSADDLAAKASASGATTDARTVPAALDQSSGGPARNSEVGQVRVWNADNYTRIVIDLGGKAKYQAARISNPDRIYFDIQNAKLSASLLHQSIDVPDGGYLKAVRVAQNSLNAVRVVLEITQAKDYSVFQLANPDRLVVDVYGPGADIAKAKSTAPLKEVAVGEKSGPAPLASSTHAAIPVPAPPSAATTASRIRSANFALSASTAEIPKDVLMAAKPIVTLPIPPRQSTPRSSSAASASAAKVPASAAASKAANDNSRGLIPASETVSSSTRDPFVTPKGVIVKSPSSRKIVAAAQPAQPDAPPIEPPTAPMESAKAAADSIGPPTLPERTKSGERSLTRALGLKIGRIVIDAGHGGHDTGTIGPTGLMEKDLCLDVALRLGKLIQERLPGTEVTYTRDNDSFVPLEQRTAIANEAKADLFLSVHANSSDDHRTSGIETYYLNFNASPQAMEVATRENATAQSSVHDLQELVTKIARNEKIEESRDLASDIQDSLSKNMEKDSHSERDRGVRKAPFVVLIGADMPSVLAEISFLSNPNDEQWLKKPENRQRIAEGLYRGVKNYLQSTNSLSTDVATANPRVQ